MSTLLERTHEIATLTSAARSVAGGKGVVIAVTGRAGLGKTRLLEAALRTAHARGLRCARARAGEVERDLGWSVAVHIVEELLSDRTQSERATLLSGRARLAATLLADDPSRDDVGQLARTQQAAVVAALTRVVGSIAAEQPVAIVVDDLHWSDGPSLRWLYHLATRIAHTPVLLVVAFRPNEPDAPAMLAELDAASSTTLRPAPLTHAATAQLVGLRLDRAADASTRAAVHEVTAGNPFLIEQLLRHLETVAVNAEAVRNARPERLAALVIPRLARLGDDARALSEAVAVLGVRCALRDAADLAGLERSAATRAAERLAATGILDDSLPLSFAHPLLREVVKASLSAARVDELRRSAARMLAGAGDPTEGAVHLLAAEPVGETWAGALLHAAGQHAMRRASYDSAAAFFGRALLEPLAAVPRHSVTLYLGRALLLAGRDRGLTALRQALEETPDHVERATVALEVGRALMAVDQPQRAVEVYDGGLSSISALDDPLKIELLAQRALAALALRDQPQRTIPAVAAALEAAAGAPDAAAGRAAVGLSAIVAVWTGEPAAECVRRLERTVATLPFGDTESLEWTPDLAWVMAGLAWCDAHERREPFLDALLERARERGALLDIASVAASRSHGRMRQGRVAEAEADARLARQIYFDLDDAHHAMVSAFELEPLVARGALAEAERLLAEAPPDRDDDQVVYLALLDARARLRTAQGRLGDARADLELLRSEVGQQGFQCPAAIAWRPQLAEVLHALGEQNEARALAAEDVEHTRRFGAPRAYGLALLASAATSPPKLALTLLEEAVEVLGGSPARLEHARALVELGALTRRLGRRGDALELLRRGLDGAAACGAGALVAAARDELRVAGARPRRERYQGPESLTAAERRVGGLAASGASNAEIARTLVVSLRTVETHLTSIYRKLDTSRGRLAEVLQPAEPSVGEHEGSAR